MTLILYFYTFSGFCTASKAERNLTAAPRGGSYLSEYLFEINHIFPNLEKAWRGSNALHVLRAFVVPSWSEM